MEDLFFEDQVFDKVDFSEQALQTGEYERCTFTGCNFTGADLSDFKFANCSFVNCNLSMVKLVKTALRTVVFKDCKMLGARFDDCSKFGLELRFENCNLSHCSFYQVNLKKAVFKNTQLIEADLTQCDLSHAVLDGTYQTWEFILTRPYTWWTPQFTLGLSMLVAMHDCILLCCGVR